MNEPNFSTFVVLSSASWDSNRTTFNGQDVPLGTNQIRRTAQPGTVPFATKDETVALPTKVLPCA